MDFSALDPVTQSSTTPISARVTVSEFRRELSRHLALVQRGPVVVTSRDVGRRAVVVSPEYFDRIQTALAYREEALARARLRSSDPERAQAEADDEARLLIDEVLLRQSEEHRRLFG